MRSLLTLTLIVAAVPATVVQNQDFEHPSWDPDPSLTLTEAIAAIVEAHPYLVDVRGLDVTRTRQVRGFLGQGLEVTIPVDGYRGFGPYARLPAVADEAWFRYLVYLDGFRPLGTGKLPGLAHASGRTTAKGCKPSTETEPGWSARIMFAADGSHGAAPGEVPIGYYLYHLGQAGACGDEVLFGLALTQRRWTCIEGRVRMNTPGANDGRVDAWVDGRHVFGRGHLAFRRSGEAHIGVREMWNNVYFGGSYPTPTPLRLVVDEIAVSTSGRVGCIDPFLDDNHSIHEGDITELHARRLLFGCAPRRVCPDDRLTRAEFAAMLHRLIRPPAGPDAFVDDNGHWAEPVLNALAGVGIIRGCNPPDNTRVCPDVAMTRAEVAAAVRRALALPAGPDAFTDDDGHWAEADINAVAAAGITRGCGPSSYCPNRTMRRGEAATFLLRIDQLRRTLQPQAPLAPWTPSGPPPPVPADEQE